MVIWNKGNVFFVSEELNCQSSHQPLYASGRNGFVKKPSHVACMGAIKPVYSIFIRESEGKRPLRRPSHTEDDNIKNT
jgi:hypothetical protein